MKKKRNSILEIISNKKIAIKRMETKSER